MTHENTTPDPWDLLEKMLDAGGEGDIDLTAMLDEDEEDESSEEKDSATKFLDLLISGGALELDEGFAAKDLAKDFVPILATGKVDKVIAWLLDHEGVADLYCSDEQLEKILAQW